MSLRASFPIACFFSSAIFLIRDTSHGPSASAELLDKIQHGGGRHLEKSEKPDLKDRLTDFDEIWHD